LQVRVRTGSRLHMGFISSSNGRRPWAGIGLAVEDPTVEVSVRESATREIVAERDHAEVVSRALELLGLGSTSFRVEVSAPRRHIGLGTTTQLTLATCTAVLKLLGRERGPIEVARLTGRGARSWVGIAVFTRGGFVVDLGRREEGWEHDLIALPFPADWGVVLCVPRDARGPDELQEGPALEAFRLDPQQVKELRSIVLGAVVPGIVGRDFREFCGGVEEVQRTVGEAFSHVQGGRFSAHSVKAVDALSSVGASGIGQSSWGPTVYGFFASIEEALRASTRVQEELGERWSVVVTRGRNRGAEVEVS